MATQTDDFNRASLGANGPNGNAWEGGSTWTVSSNRLVSPSGSSGALYKLVYNTTFANADLQAWMDGGTLPSATDAGLTFRWTDNSNCFYAGLTQDSGAHIGFLVIRKVEAGVDTSLAEWDLTGESFSFPCTLRLRINGSAITAYIDGTNLGAPDTGSASSSFNSTATRHGFYTYGSGSLTALFDDWSITDDLTIAVADSDSFAVTDAISVLGVGASDSATVTESAGVSFDRSARGIGESLRVTETELVSVANVDPLLARPLYALIEQNPLTATVIDYLDVVPDDEWRESGIDIDI